MHHKRDAFFFDVYPKHIDKTAGICISKRKTFRRRYFNKILLILKKLV